MKVLLDRFVGVLFLFLLLGGPAMSLLFRNLVRLQYRSHRQSWEQDGKPTGPYFYPPETRTWGGWIVRWSSLRASNNRFGAWLLATPAWIREDRRALRLLFWMRALVFSWLAVFFALFIILGVVSMVLGVVMVLIGIFRWATSENSSSRHFGE